VELLHQIINDRYRELPPENYPDDEQEIVRMLNTVYRQKTELLADYTSNLKRSEGRLREIIENTPVGICITDENGYFEYVNPPYCKLYQYRSDELLGKHFTTVVPDYDKERLSHLHSEFMGRRWELRGEWTVVRRDGREISILADAAYIIDVDGHPKKVTFVVDITDRKYAEEQLRETVDQLNHEIDERKRVEHVKRQVERIIQHDLRSPLSGIMTAADLLLRQDPSDDQRQLVQIIKDSARKLNAMISSSLDLVRMEEGSYVLRPEQVNIVDVFEAVKNELRSICGARQVGVDYFIDDMPVDWDSTHSLYGETIYLQHLLGNLIRNAVEASEAGERVTVRVKSGTMFTFDIHNPAVVPERMRDVFFERYATYGKQNGNGLGTYIAALVTRVHHGTISFTTNEEEGTHVYVNLPRLPDQNAVKD